MPFYPFFGKGSPTKIDYRKKKKRVPLFEPLKSSGVQCKDPCLKGQPKNEPVAMFVCLFVCLFVCFWLAWARLVNGVNY